MTVVPDPAARLAGVCSAAALELTAPPRLVRSDSNDAWSSTSGTVVLLDFEWARFGPPELDLQRLCDNADADTRNGDDLHPSILRWLAVDYPDLFEGADLPERMRLYSLTFAIREIVLGPPNQVAEHLPADHAVHRLRRLIDGDWPAPGSLPESLMPH